MKIGISGLGFVGNAMQVSFTLNGFILNDTLFTYDKYKNGGIGSLENLLKCNIIFMALPTLFSKKLNSYNKDAIKDNLKYLMINKYDGVVVIKSTVEPETINKLSKEYNLKIIHNPEFLTARTAVQDFHKQKHIVLGKGLLCSNKDVNMVKHFYNKYYPLAKISLVTSTESESMKIFVNSFYSVKIQFFTELYALCKKNNTDFNKIKDLMIKNNWINPMHTNVPGHDGNISYGGACFPKDTNALNKYMELKKTPNKVLNACIKERNEMRDDENTSD